MKRFIPKVTVRRMLIFVFLFAGYFGMWEATKRAAARIQQNADQLEREMLAGIEAGRLDVHVDPSFVDVEFTSPCPFVIHTSRSGDVFLYANGAFFYAYRAQQYKIWLPGVSSEEIAAYTPE